MAPSAWTSLRYVCLEHRTSSHLHLSVFSGGDIHPMAKRSLGLVHHWTAILSTIEGQGAGLHTIQRHADLASADDQFGTFHSQLVSFICSS